MQAESNVVGFVFFSAYISIPASANRPRPTRVHSIVSCIGIGRPRPMLLC